jgi:lactate permease
MIEVWPATLVAGVSFAIQQFLISNYHGPWLVDVLSSVVSMGCLIAFLNYWRPQKIWRTTTPRGQQAGLAATEGSQGPGSTAAAPVAPARAEVIKAWIPWLILSVAVILWGTPQFKALLDGISVLRIPVTGVHNLIERMPPVVVKPTAEAAVYVFNWLSATGSGILVAAVVAGVVMGLKVGLHNSCTTLRKLRTAKASEIDEPFFSKPIDLLRKVRGIELVAPSRPDECCGFGGTFSIFEEAGLRQNGLR